jgi:TRAP-type uncharacterized transport system substrate-binding protein
MKRLPITAAALAAAGLLAAQFAGLPAAQAQQKFITIGTGVYYAAGGVLATLVSSSKVPADTIYVAVKAVFDNFDEFKKLHPALAILDPWASTTVGLTAPLHDGAVRYYKQRGWLK